ncbi:aminodeoxychorismate lyase [Methylophaga sp. 42_8_T64]|nr:aminodeoxychorismate lyase [Methylophaga sp. 42_8_T64]
MILVNGQPENSIHVLDRGLQYGDGLFETLAFRHGQLEFLNAHLSRLYRGCDRLKIGTQQLDSLLTAEIEQICNDLVEDSVIKIIITRGQGSRGYRIQADSPASRIISTHAMPNYPQKNQQGIRVRLCQQTLSENTSLAGIKHLNRLEQVLARSEWDDDEISEGLMFNTQQQLIEGTMSNIFIVKDGELFTPELALSGVAGIMREQIIHCTKQAGIAVVETVLTKNDLKNADEIFLSNSIIDIWPIIEIDGFSTYIYGNITKKVQTLVANLTR